MNVLLSFLVYNPIEAYTLILLCDIITGNIRNNPIKKIRIVLIFSTCNLLIQIIPYLFYNSKLFAIINLFVAYFILPVSVKYFYELCGNKISYKRCVIVQLINSIFIIVISSFTSITFGINSIFYNENGLHEFIINTIIYSLQISLYSLIKRKVLCYEKSN